MAKLEIPIVVDISEIESLIDEIKHLQTYKLSYGDEQILIDREDVIKIFAAHVRANIEPERKKGHWIVINESAGLYECDQCHEWSCCVGKYCMHCGSPMEVEDGTKA
ncbi:MAG: hypothetical protein IJK56_11130 [Firmicutes bacterium]|nr:hypothetical protein [Bacillota bacterium]